MESKWTCRHCDRENRAAAEVCSCGKKRPIKLSALIHRTGGGLVCPHCQCRHFMVVYTRQKPGGIERRRSCRHCGFRITTHETVKF